MGYSVKLKVWGDFACFSRPETKVERMSYEVMTPSAARGILEAILWKPAIVWQINQIDVLKPIRWTSIRRNELGSVISTRNAIASMKKGTGKLGVYIEEERQQRASLVLQDVSYIIHATFSLTGAAGSDDNPQKFIEMFQRRVQKGQCFQQPYFGTREFAAFFAPVDMPEQTIDDNRELGWMLHDLDYGKGITPKFFDASLKNGQLLIPPFKDQGA